jgi:peptidoglycan glycosyltransferase
VAHQGLLTGGTIVLHLLALHVVVSHFRGSAPEPEGLAKSAQPSHAPSAAEAGRARDEPDAAPASQPAPEAPSLDEGRPGPLDLRRIAERDEGFVADLGGGWAGELTLDVTVQRAAQRALLRTRAPLAAAVVLDLGSAEILALADHYDEKRATTPKLTPDGPPHLALRALAPAASVFKLVTAAALLEGGLSATAAFSYTPALRKILPEHLKAPAAGAPSSDLGKALADSNNGLFARLADGRLAREDLDAAARRFGFGRAMRFALPVEPSAAGIPHDRLERARTAAGFWRSTLSPLHGALLAAAIANDGTLPTPRLVRRVLSPRGLAVEAPPEPAFSQATTPAHARALRRMLGRTVASGTARAAFREWPERLRHIRVAGKTGTLRDRAQGIEYTWFVGFAPVEAPTVAFAFLVGNDEKVYARASHVAAQVLAAHFDAEAKTRRASAEVTPPPREKRASARPKKRAAGRTTTAG